MRWALVLAVLASGCTRTRDVSLSLGFESPSIRAAAARLVVSVHPTAACPSVDALVRRDESVRIAREVEFSPALPVAIGAIDPGPAAISVVARSADCGVVASACATFNAADDTAITLTLRAPTTTGLSCAPGAACAGAGRCATGVDASVDAGVDAEASDAGVDGGGACRGAADTCEFDEAQLCGPYSGFTFTLDDYNASCFLERPADGGAPRANTFCATQPDDDAKAACMRACLRAETTALSAPCADCLARFATCLGQYCVLRCVVPGVDCTACVCDPTDRDTSACYSEYAACAGRASRLPIGRVCAALRGEDDAGVGDAGACVTSDRCDRP